MKNKYKAMKGTQSKEINKVGTGNMSEAINRCHQAQYFRITKKPIKDQPDCIKKIIRGGMSHIGGRSGAQEYTYRVAISGSGQSAQQAGSTT